MQPTLVVTNDFPPRTGGIQTFVHELTRRLDPASIVVYAPAWPEAAQFDAAQAFPVVRHHRRLLLPTPALARQLGRLAAARGCTAVWFGAALPLAVLARSLRRYGVARIVASTHGHEAGLARLPGPAQLLRRAGREVDVVTYLGDYTRRRLATHVPDRRLVRLPPGVDVGRFAPGTDGRAIRRQWGLLDRPTVVCVSRLVPRKGQDLLIRALPRVRRHVSDVALLVVGDGPDRDRLQRLAVRHRVADAVRFTGAVSPAELPVHYAAGDVFAMPCRSRFGGLEVEGLGIVYLEASACGLPVVAGRSGGAPDAVRAGRTGVVVSGRSSVELADRLIELLTRPEWGRQLGRAGREWVADQWSWEHQAQQLRQLLT